MFCNFEITGKEIVDKAHVDKASVFSRAGSAGCRPAPGLCRPAIKKPAGRQYRAEIGLSENVWLISVSLLVTEL